MSKLKHIYTDSYGGGSRIATELDESNGNIKLSIRTLDGMESSFILGQMQATDLAYGILKGINVFQHVLRDQIEEGAKPSELPTRQM